MKDLIKFTLNSGDFGWMGALALVLFFMVMVGVFFWIHRPGTKDYYEIVCKDAIKGDHT